ncbi:MAG: hypothetical protein GY801_47865, partial [bacterium]|nr:hypothetical protein [bacterium]
RSAPNIESIKRFVGEEKIWPIDKPTWQYHHAVIKEEERDAVELGGADDLEHWIMSTQIGHGQVHRHNLEYCRQTKYWCSGNMQWQINGSWPSFHRELIDWYGVPKGSFYAYKRSALDQIVLADFEKYTFDGNEEVKVDIYAVNDAHLRVGDCTVNAVIYDVNMHLLHQQAGSVAVEADASAKVMTLNWTVPADFLNKVFFAHLELRYRDDLVAENLYWLGTTSYAQPERNMTLTGPWQFQVGKEIDELQWTKCLMPSYWALPQHAPEDPEDSVWYRHKFVIPADWQRTELEVYCAGFEGNDDVWLNGEKIGATEEEMTIELGTDDLLFTEKAAERKAVEKGAEVKLDKKVMASKEAGGTNRYNIRVNSDPFITPNLIKRFYALPRGVVKVGQKNVLEVRLYGEYATGISEPMYIRKASTPKEQQAIIDYNNAGEHLAEIRQLPEVDLDVDVYCESTVLDGKYAEARMLLHVENNTPNLAFFTEFKLEGLGGDAILIFDDNYTHMLPNTEKDIWVRVINQGYFSGDKAVNVMVGGWNAKKKTVKELTLTLK